MMAFIHFDVTPQNLLRTSLALVFTIAPYKIVFKPLQKLSSALKQRWRAWQFLFTGPSIIEQEYNKVSLSYTRLIVCSHELSANIRIRPKGVHLKFWLLTLDMSSFLRQSKSKR